MSKVDLSSAANVLSNHFKSSPTDSMVLVSKKLMKLLAAPLLVQMGIKKDRATPVKFLDSACGTGVVTQELQAILSSDVREKSSFICADTSEVLVNLVKGRIETEGWVNTEARVLDAMDTGLEESSLTHVAIALGMHLIPQPDNVLRDCKRILKNGGTFGATTFPLRNSLKFWGPDMRDAFASLPYDAPYPENLPMQTHESGKWYDPEWIESHLKEQGFTDVQVHVVPGQYYVENSEQFVAFFGMMISYIMNTWWSEELRGEHSVEEVKSAVREYLGKKHEAGWDIEWEVISMTGVVSK